MSSEAVLKLLDDHHRPMSVNEIHSSVKGDYAKSAIQKALDSLVEKDKVTEKTYGKQKVYFISQNSDLSTQNINESLLETGRHITELTLQLKDVTDKLNVKSKAFSETKGKMSIAEATDVNMKLDTQIAFVETELEKYKGVEIVDPKRKRAIEKGYEQHLAEYRKRKRLCMNILNEILENYPKTKKELFEAIGIETDEDVGFSFR